MRLGIQGEYLIKKEDFVGLIKQISVKTENKKHGNDTVTKKDFGKMMRYEFPCKNIVRLTHLFDNDVQYFLIDRSPAEIFQLMQESKSFYCSFKQLTGGNAGKIYHGEFNPAMQDHISIYKSRKDKNKITLSIHHYDSYDIEQSYNDLERKFGKTISIAELIMLWKHDNGQKMSISTYNSKDYDMITSLYNSEDILTSSNKQFIIK